MDYFFHIKYENREATNALDYYILATHLFDHQK